MTAGYAEYLAGLPARLSADYDCRVRVLTGEEAHRLGGRRLASWAVEPTDPDSATILLASSDFEGATSATVGFGIAAQDDVPTCFCDACDENSDSLIQLVEAFIERGRTDSTLGRRPICSTR